MDKFFFGIYGRVRHAGNPDAYGNLFIGYFGKLMLETFFIILTADRKASSFLSGGIRQ